MKQARARDVEEGQNGEPMARTEPTAGPRAPEPDDDQALVACVQAGGPGAADALEALLARYHRPLQQYLDRLLGDPEAAADLVQETFLKMIGALPRYQPRARFSTWLYTIAHRLALDFLRRRRREQRTDSLDDPARAAAEPASSDRPVAEVALDRVTRDDIRAVLARLSPEHRAVILLHYFEGFSYKEIAQTVGCTVGTVGSRLHYALRAVRRELDLGETE